MAGKARGVHIRQRVAEHGKDFDEFTLRIAGGSLTEFTRLMKSQIREYTIAAEHYLEKVVSAHNAAERAKNKRR